MSDIILLFALLFIFAFGYILMRRLDMRKK